MADLPKPRVAVIRHDVPNAFATGRNPKHAAVAVTTGLWRRLEPREIEGVLAHELSHIANRDVLVMTLASFFAMVAGLLTRFGLYAACSAAATATTTGPPVWLDRRCSSRWSRTSLSYILIRSISRYREYAADRGAALITGAPENLMSALQKIASRDDADPAARPPRGAGDERVLHRPDELKKSASASCSRPTRRWRSASRRSRRSRARWAGPSTSSGPADVLFGRKKLKAREGRPALRDLDGPRDAGGRARPEAGAARAAVVFKSLSSGEFVRVENEIQQLLDVAAARVRVARSSARTDEFGFEWLDRRDDDFEDLVTTVHLVGLGAQGRAASGSSSSLRTSASTAASTPVYFIYGFKRGAFWPFVPTGEDKERDNARSSS